MIAHSHGRRDVRLVDGRTSVAIAVVGGPHVPPGPRDRLPWPRYASDDLSDSRSRCWISWSDLIRCESDAEGPASVFGRLELRFTDAQIEQGTSQTWTGR